MSRKDLKFTELLARVAEDVAPVFRARIAAGIVIKNELISIGTNQVKTHPLQAKFAKHYQAIHIHAEIDAIAKAVKKIDPKRLANATLYVTRVKQDREGNPVYGLAKPCQGCTRAIASFGLKRVVWTNDEDIDGKLILGE